MTTTEQLHLPQQVMTSPADTNLDLVLFKTKEGIGQLGVTTYEGVCTFKELADNFGVEANSDTLAEEFKKQRDVDQLRVRGLKHYWSESKGPVFPSMTLFCNELAISSVQTLGNREFALATLQADSDRFICDGQGRTTFIQWLMQQAGTVEQFGDYTIAFKLIVTHTESLSVPPAARIIKQVFSDYHTRLKKPNKSVSKHFDSSTPFARLVNELLDLDVVSGGTIKRRIALHGKLKPGHLWTFEQFTTMIQTFLKLTAVNANRQLEADENYESALALCTAFLNRVFTVLPITELDGDNYTSRHEDFMFTKAIFSKALAYLGRSVVDEMVLDESVGWDKLGNLSVPMLSKADPYWIKNKVCMEDGDSVKIIKATDRRIGALLCRSLRVYPCQELAA